MHEPLEFDGVIEGAGGGGAAIPVPFDPKAAFGTGRSVRVVATYDGFTSTSNVVTMGGQAVLGIHKATRAAIAKDIGDRVHVTLVRDTAERTVDVPAELERVLAREPLARELFDALPPSHRREFADWVAEARKQETRERRAEKAAEMLGDGRTP